LLAVLALGAVLAGTLAVLPVLAAVLRILALLAGRLAFALAGLAAALGVVRRFPLLAARSTDVEDGVLGVGPRQEGAAQQQRRDDGDADAEPGRRHLLRHLQLPLAQIAAQPEKTGGQQQSQ